MKLPHALVLGAALASLYAPAQSDARTARKRPAWTGSQFRGTPEPPLPYKIADAYPKLRFSRPVEVVTAPGSNRLFVAELGGKIVSFVDREDSETKDTFCDFSKVAGFGSLYSLVFHPKYPKNPSVFVMYAVRDGSPDGSRVSRLTVDTAGPSPRCRQDSERILLTWFSGGHNGGSLQFGRDGMLYVSSGDGASPFPPDKFDVGQSLGDLMSSIQRIDVDRADPGLPYGIPKDNPFVGVKGARGEIWAFGFRNPWKMSFEPNSDALWVGDVGWETWELIHRVDRGGNYGWSLMEGSLNLRPDLRRGSVVIIPPVIAHAHNESRSITGGVVYTGKSLPELAGAYVYGDFETGKMWGLRYDPVQKKVTWQAELAEGRRNLVAFGRDTSGELLAVDYGGATFSREFQAATISRLMRNEGGRAESGFPRLLSKTGIFRNVKGHVLAPGVVPYRVNAEPWADGAKSQHFVALPGSETIGVDQKKGLVFPAGSVLGKTFRLGGGTQGRSVETQILHFEDGEWRGYSYRWDQKGTDASLVDKRGEQVPWQVDGPKGSKEKQSWRHFSRAECLTCHNIWGGPLLGFSAQQLDDGKGGRGQLQSLVAAGVIAALPPQKSDGLANPNDPKQDVAARARAYLHINCSHCHRFGGGGSAGLQLQHELSLKDLRVVGDRPLAGAFGISAAALVKPGDPFRSVLFYRLATQGSGHMPRLGGQGVDGDGLALMETWIRSLSPPVGAAPDKADPAYQQVVTTAARLRALGPATEQQPLIDTLLQSTEGALYLARAIDGGRIPQSLRADVINKGSHHEKVEIRGLFERFLPEDQRVPRLGDSIDTAALLAKVGDAARGRALFEGNLGCPGCHLVGNQGGRFGPDLSQVGTRLAREKLLESLIEPSRQIDPKFVLQVLETTDGESREGIILERNADGVVMIDAKNIPERVAQARIRRILPQDVSAMPQGLLAALTAQEAADLLAFLVSLR